MIKMFKSQVFKFICLFLALCLWSEMTVGFAPRETSEREASVYTFYVKPLKNPQWWLNEDTFKNIDWPRYIRFTNNSDIADYEIDINAQYSIKNQYWAGALVSGILVSGVTFSLFTGIGGLLDLIANSTHRNKKTDEFLITGYYISIPVDLFVFIRWIKTNKIQAAYCALNIKKITDLRTGKIFPLEENISVKRKFYETTDEDAIHGSIKTTLEQNFKDFFIPTVLSINKENQKPGILLENMASSTIRASKIRVPIQVSDDVELNRVNIENSMTDFSASNLAGGFKQKALEYVVPVKPGTNAITISVEDWCGKISKKTINLTVLKDPENTTYTLGSSGGSDVPIVIATKKPKVEYNVDLVPQTGMNNHNGIAIIIGNKNYKKSTSVPMVEYADNDANTIYALLSKSLGFKTIYFLKDATLSDFNSYFGTESELKGKLFNSVIPGKSDVFIYYSGHGAPGLKNHKAYLAPVDCDPTTIELNGYPLETLYRNLSLTKAHSVTVLIDACFSGTNLFKDISPIVVKVENPLMFSKNTTIMTSSSLDQVSSWYPEKKHGLFTYFLLEAVANKNADYDKNNNVSFGEIYRYISDNSQGVPYFARSIHNLEQMPQMNTADTNRVFIKY